MRRSSLDQDNDPAFPLVRGHFVGLGGLEPPASSLSAIMGLPLCNPAFLQVARDRQGRSNALLHLRPGPAHGRGAMTTGKVCPQLVAGKVMGLPGGRGSPIECVTVTVVRPRARPEPC